MPRWRVWEWHDGGVDATEAQLEHEAVEVLRAAGARFAFVFGSVAEGRSTPASDLDVAAWWGEEAPASWGPEAAGEG